MAAMSWKLNQELRAAKLAGLLPDDLKFTDLSVLLILTDTCRSESRVASISMAELEKLSGQTRVQMWRDIKRLIDLGLLKRVGGRGNQYQANRYEILLPDAGRIGETSTDSSDPGAGCTDVTSKPSDEKVLVTSEKVLVTSEASAGYIAMQHIPVPEKNYPGERGGVQDSRPVATVPDHGDALSLSNGSHNNHNDDPEPPEFCSAHMPHGTSTPCRGCKTARINHDRWKDRQSARLVAEMRARDTTPSPQLVLDEIEPEIPDPEPDPVAPVCAADGCGKPATVDGLCGRCAIYRQPERVDLVANSAGGGALMATAKKRRKQVAA